MVIISFNWPSLIAEIECHCLRKASDVIELRTRYPARTEPKLLSSAFLFLRGYLQQSTVIVIPVY